MSITVTMLQTRRGEGGATWTAGGTYSASDAFGSYLITSNLATGQLPAVPPTSLSPAQATAAVALVSEDGNPLPALLLLGGDHPYTQWYGTNGRNGMAQMYADRGLKPYCAVNTEVTTRTSPAVGVNNLGFVGDHYMDWPEVRAVADRVEFVSHGHRHFGTWTRTNTGLRIRYLGANATATVDISATQMVLAAGGAEGATITWSAQPTIAQVVTAINAVNGGASWLAIPDAVLDGTEASNNILPINAARNVKVTTAYNDYFCAGGGIYLKYTGPDFESVIAGVSTTGVLQIWGDGKQLCFFDTSNASYDTIAELVSAINALSVSGLIAARCDEGQSGAYANYSPLGNELSNKLRWKEFVQIGGHGQIFDMGVPRSTTIQKNFSKAQAVARANGIALDHFAQPGQSFGPSIIGGDTDTKSFRGDGINPKREIGVGQQQADVGGNFRYHTALTNNVTRPQLLAMVQALADSPGWMCDWLVHKVLPDGSSGYSLPTADLAYYDQVEGDLVALLDAVKTQVDAGKIRQIAPNVAHRIRHTIRPTNYLFNPKFRNSGDVLIGRTSSSDQIATKWGVPGWRVITPAYVTGLAIDGDGVVTVTANASTQNSVLRQEVVLTPGETYEIGIQVAFPTVNSGTPSARLGIVSDYGRGLDGLGLETKNPANRPGLYSPGLRGDGEIYWRFTVPAYPSFGAAVVKSIVPAGTTYDLSSGKNIRLNIWALGDTADIDCSGVTAAATTAQEMADKINAGIKATAAYAAYPQLWTIARAEHKQLVIRAPWRATDTISAAGSAIRVTAGGTADGMTAIFGTGGVSGHGSNSPHMPIQSYPMNLVIEHAVDGVMKFWRPYIRPLRSV